MRCGTEVAREKVFESEHMMITLCCPKNENDKKPRDFGLWVLSVQLKVIIYDGLQQVVIHICKRNI